MTSDLKIHENGSLGAHEAPLYIHAHFMLIHAALGKDYAVILMLYECVSLNISAQWRL